MGVYFWVEPQPITTAGIYHNSDLGLISVSADGSIRYTIADKNLGATSVFNQGDAETDANCGKFYQWGNNYGFDHSGGVGQSTTQVNASTYGPGNYYSSYYFIRTNRDWSSVQNDNLWGATTGTNEAMQGPCDTGFHVPTKDEWVALCGILTNTFSMAANSTTMGTYLKMSNTGRRDYYDAVVYGVGGNGRYWSSSPSTTGLAYDVYFNSSSISPQESLERAYGFSIRPFKNTPTQPDTTRTVLYQPS